MTRCIDSTPRPPRRRPGRVASLGTIMLVSLTLGGCIVEVPATQSAGAASGYGYTCYAGVYVCRLPQQLAAGTQCSCPGIGAPSFGSVR